MQKVRIEKDDVLTCPHCQGRVAKGYADNGNWHLYEVRGIRVIYRLSLRHTVARCDKARGSRDDHQPAKG